MIMKSEPKQSYPRYFLGTQHGPFRGAVIGRQATFGNGSSFGIAVYFLNANWKSDFRDAWLAGYFCEN
jgi:hypothetical protein